MRILHHGYNLPLLLLAVLHHVHGHDLDDIKQIKRIVIDGPDEISSKSNIIIYIFKSFPLLFVGSGSAWLRAIPSFRLRPRVRDQTMLENKELLMASKHSAKPYKRSLHIHEVMVVSHLLQSLYQIRNIIHKQARKHGNAKYISRGSGCPHQLFFIGSHSKWRC